MKYNARRKCKLYFDIITLKFMKGLYLENIKLSIFKFPFRRRTYKVIRTPKI